MSAAPGRPKQAHPLGGRTPYSAAWGFRSAAPGPKQAHLLGGRPPYPAAWEPR